MKDSRMKFPMAALLVAALSAASLAACSERPQRQVPGEHSYNIENGVSPLQERTLKQGESGRMGI